MVEAGGEVSFKVNSCLNKISSDLVEMIVEFNRHCYRRLRFGARD